MALFGVFYIYNFIKLKIYSFWDIINDKPIVTKKVWTNKPDVKPREVITADFNPFDILCEITYIISGPGDSVNNNDVKKKVIKISISINNLLILRL